MSSIECFSKAWENKGVIHRNSELYFFIISNSSAWLRLMVGLSLCINQRPDSGSFTENCWAAVQAGPWPWLLPWLGFCSLGDCLCNVKSLHWGTEAPVLLFSSVKMCREFVEGTNSVTFLLNTWHAKKAYRYLRRRNSFSNGICSCIPFLKSWMIHLWWNCEDFLCFNRVLKHFLSISTEENDQRHRTVCAFIAFHFSVA